MTSTSLTGGRHRIHTHPHGIPIVGPTTRRPPAAETAALLRLLWPYLLGAVLYLLLVGALLIAVAGAR